MSDLLNKKCKPCEGGTLPFDISEIHKYQKKQMDGMFMPIKKKFTSQKKNLLLKILLIAKTL